nr:MAG TPA: hypothetical protein [Caudoviricetes sp.]
MSIRYNDFISDLKSKSYNIELKNKFILKINCFTDSVRENRICFLRNCLTFKIYNYAKSKTFERKGFYDFHRW